MFKFISIFYDIVVWLGIVPILIGFFKFKYLTNQHKIFLFVISCVYAIYVTSQVISRLGISTHILYYLMFYISVIGYFIYYSTQVSLKYLKKLTYLLATIFFIYITLELIKNGIKPFLNLPYLFSDFALLPFALRIYFYEKSSKSLKILNLGIIINFIFDIASTTINTFFYNFFQNKLFQLYFFGVTPIFILTFFIFQSYSFYLASKEARPSFERNLDFN